jgi:hypothetical protein
MPDSLQDTGIVVKADGSIATLYTRALDRVVDVLQVANSNAETDIYSRQISAAEGRGHYRLRLGGQCLHNNLAGDTLTVRAYFGGTKLVDGVWGLSALIGANFEPWWGEVHLVFNLVGLWLDLNFRIQRATAAAPTLGIGGDAAPANELMLARNLVAPLKPPGLFRVSVQWSVANANDDFRLQRASLELV